VTALREHRKCQAEARLAAGPLWQDTGLVFTTSVGAPLDASHVRRNFRALCEKAGIEGIWTPRELRHTFVSERLRLPADAVPDRDRRVLPRASRGPAVFPGVAGGNSQVFLASPYMIFYRVDRGRPTALLRDLRPSPGDPARRGPEINSTPLASPRYGGELVITAGSP
jgi:hypothetical protein